MRLLTYSSLATLLLCFLLFYPSLTSAKEKNGFDISDSLVPQDEILLGGPPKDGIPAIHRPRFQSAAKSSLAPQEKILGIYLGGIAKAYPIRILNWHEIVNDRIDQDSFVITYCPLCGTGIAFSSMIDGQTHHFGVSGLLYNSDVLLYDLETHSLWSQILGSSISGSLKKTSLTPLPLLHTNWRNWQKRHPDTLVLTEETGYARNYDTNPYADYETSKRLYFKVANQSPQWLHPKEKVLGVSVDGKYKAYPFSELRKFSKEKFLDTFNGKTLTIFWDGMNDTGYIQDEQGEDIPIVQGFWFAWYSFHPTTQVFTTP